MENISQNERTMNLNWIFDRATSDMEVLMQFASHADIPAEILSKCSVTALNCSSNKTSFILNFEDYDAEKEVQNEETVTFTFNRMKQFVTIARRSETKYDFVTIGVDSMTNYERYIRHSDQTVTEFKVNGDSLDVTTASIAQTVREDSMGGGDWIIANFNSISDFEDENHLKFAARGAKPEINKQTYKIPACYRLQDGLDSVISANKYLVK